MDLSEMPYFVSDKLKRFFRQLAIMNNIRECVPLCGVQSGKEIKPMSIRAKWIALMVAVVVMLVGMQLVV